jgi:hypothetical protein
LAFCSVRGEVKSRNSSLKNLLKYLDKGDPLRMREWYYIQNEAIDNVFSIKSIPQTFKILKMAYLINDFVRRMNKYRKRSVIIGQKKALKEDKVLTKYTNMTAEQFVKEQKIEYLHEIFFDPVVQSTVFKESHECNAFYYLAVLIPMVRRTYAADFRHVIPRITKGFKHKIDLDEAIDLTKRKDDKYVIKTKNNKYLANKVVIATPYTHANKFYPVQKSGPVVPIYVHHIVGKREEVYDKKKVVFFKPKHHDITILWKQPTGSDVIFSKFEKPYLDKYYEYFHIVKSIFWKNSMMLSGSVDNWVDHILDDNLYLASDYNICGLEDSYLTGVHAANNILKN